MYLIIYVIPMNDIFSLSNRTAEIWNVQIWISSTVIPIQIQMKLLSFTATRSKMSSISMLRLVMFMPNCPYAIGFMIITMKFSSAFLQAFEEIMDQYKLPPSWQKLSDKQRKDVLLKLLDHLDLSQKTARMKAVRTVLYLAQGCFCEIQSDVEQQEYTRQNVKLLYEMGMFPVFVELLNFEIEYVLLEQMMSDQSRPSHVRVIHELFLCRNASTANNALRKVAVSLADSVDLRLILSVLYIMTEVIRSENEAGSEDFQEIAESITNELSVYLLNEEFERSEKKIRPNIVSFIII